MPTKKRVGYSGTAVSNVMKAINRLSEIDREVLFNGIPPVKKWKEKAEKWDELDEKISKFYPDDSAGTPDDEGGDLCDIGEAAATAFGYL